MTRVIPLALAIGLIAAGCGSDDSGESTAATTVSIPPVTTPGLTTATSPATTTVPAQTATSKGGKTFNPSLPDSETNDIPPAKGSPQEQFENQCNQNPSACG